MPVNSTLPADDGDLRHGESRTTETASTSTGNVAA
jgi:hypothetical protein